MPFFLPSHSFRVSLRVKVSWKPEDVPVKRETRYEQSRKERIKDPVLGRFRDTSLESNAIQTEEQKLTQKLNAARDRQLNYSQTFNIVNHKSNCDGLAGMFRVVVWR
jgi:hypothetical protein